MNNEERAELKQLAEAAPSGPWIVAEPLGGTMNIYAPNADDILITQVFDDQLAEARYIAAANPSVVLSLLAENETLKVELAKARSKKCPHDLAREFLDGAK